jgi:hypothetical protein
MHSKVLLAGVVAAGCSFATATADLPTSEMIGLGKEANVIEKRDGSDGAMPTRVPKWESTVPPQKVGRISDAPWVCQLLRFH